MCKEIMAGLVLLIVVIWLILWYKNRKESYSSLSNDEDNYYMWRTYSSNPYDVATLTKFPFNYQPYEHPQRVNCNGVHDIISGIGNW